MRVMDISPRVFALLVAAYTFSASLFGLFGALWLDRFDRKRALQVLYLGFMVGTLGCAFAPGAAVLGLCRAIAGAFGGLLGALLLSIIGDVFPSERRGMAMGVLMSAFSLASVLGVPMGLYLATQWNWHAPFLFLAGLSLVFWLLATLALPAMKSHRNAAQYESLFSIFALIRKHPSQRWALTLIVTMMFAGFTVIPFISPYLVANVGIREAQLPYIYLVGGSFVFFTSQIIGRLADRFGTARMFQIVSTVSLAPLLVMTHLPAMALGGVLVVTTLFFIFVSGRMVPAMAMITSTVSPQHRGRFMSLNSSFQMLGSGLAAMTSGMLVHKAPAGKLLHYGWVGWLAAFASVACLFIVNRIQPHTGSGTTS